MGKQTPLYDEHVRLDAKVVDFAGWDMPLHYGSQIDEHNKVRKDAGMFDVSHMTVVDLQGKRCRELLGRLLANNIERLKQKGKALYSCMLNEQGGIIDDLIAFYVENDQFRLVVNAATREKDIAWISRLAGKYEVQVEERADVAMIAVQGPQARGKVHKVMGPALGIALDKLAPFYSLSADGMFISRTGYTGEDGYEIILPAAEAVALWQALIKEGVSPIGLGARDTLRLEAGMNLYGTDMDESTTPLESGLSWTVAWEPEGRDFIGRTALEEKRGNPATKRFVGLILSDRGVLRSHQRVFKDNKQVGEVTSGTFSPVLGKAIAFARIVADVEGDCMIEMRGKELPAMIVKPPFVRHGKSCYE